MPPATVVAVQPAATLTDSDPAVKFVGPRVYGPDVSHWQEWVDWRRVASSPARPGMSEPMRFAFTKATQGRRIDSRLNYNWRRMAEVGLVRGAYDFADFSKNPILDARFYVGAIRAAGGFRTAGDFAVLDAEGPTALPPHAVVRWIRAWTLEVQRLTKYPQRRIVIYTGKWWWTPHAGNSTLFARAGNPLWLSGYSREPSLPGWTWSWWQYSESEDVHGVSGPSDMSVWRGNVQALRKLAGYPVPPKVVPSRTAPPRVAVAKAVANP